LAAHLKSAGLPTSIADLGPPRPSADELIAHMAHDKKAIGGRVTFVLTRGLGHAYTTADVPQDVLRTVLSG
jgi:3-dehydroquinate synthase